eukprot:jgi/Psemu1/32450/gm1.32450_g
MAVNTHSVQLSSRNLAEKLVDQLDELFMAKLEVVFCSRPDAQNIDVHFGKGNKLSLSCVFKHLEGSNFKYYTLLEFKTWDCFDDSKDELKIFKKSHTGLYAARWVMFTSKREDFCTDMVPPRDNVSDQTQDKGNNSDEGNNTDGKLENNIDLKPAAKVTMLKEQGEENNVNESGNTAKMVGANDNNNESEQNVQLLNYSLDATVSKFPLKVGRGFALLDTEVMLKDPDMEILYPIYQIGQAVITSVIEKGSKYDPDSNGDTEVQEEDKQY